MKTALTREQLRRIDQRAVERYGIPGLILMENAGRSAAELIHGYYDANAGVAVFCGRGNNGGDGCVIARHLHNRDVHVHVVVTANESAMTPDMRTNFSIVRAMNLDVERACDAEGRRAALDRLNDTIVVVDALLGTGFHGDIRPPLAELTSGINQCPHRAVVAIDVPSGLDCDTGHASPATIRADRTITFVAVKKGFTRPEAKAYVGEVDVASIGAPRELIESIARD